MGSRAQLCQCVPCTACAGSCLCHELSACVGLTLEHCGELVSIACLRRRKGIRFYHAGFRVMTDVATAGTCRHVQHKHNHILLLVVVFFFWLFLYFCFDAILSDILSMDVCIGSLNV